MPARRSIVCSFVLSLALLAPAVADDNPVDLSELTTAVENRRIAQLAVPLTRAERRCIKAYDRVSTLLKTPVATRTGSGKTLKKIEAKLRKWLIAPQVIDTPTKDGLEGAAEEYGVDLNAEALRIIGAVKTAEDLEETRKLKRLVRKLAKLVVKTESQLAKAGAADSLKIQLKNQFAASRSLDKAGKLVAQLPEPDPDGPGSHDVARTSIVTYTDDNGFVQLGAVDVCSGAGEPARPRQLTSGLSDSEDWFAITSSEGTNPAGDVVAAYLQDNGLYRVNVSAPNSTPELLLDLTDGPNEPSISLSPAGDTLTIFGEGGTTYFVVVDLFSSGTSAFELDLGDVVRVRGCTWTDDGRTCAFDSIEGNAPPLARLDLAHFDGQTATLEFLAGGAEEGRSCADASFSPDGRYCGFSAIDLARAGTLFLVCDLQTNTCEEFDDSIVAISSDPDFSVSQRIACEWIDATTCAFNAVPGLSAASFPDGLDSAVIQILEAAGQFYTVHGQTETHAFIHDQQDRQLMSIEKATLNVTPLGSAGLLRPASAVNAVINGIVFSDVPAGGQLNLEYLDAATGTITRVATVQPDPEEAARTRVDNMQLAFFEPGLLSVLFNVVANDTDVAGIRLTSSSAAQGGAPEFGPLRTLVPQPANSEFSEFSLILLDNLLRPSTDVGIVIELVERSFSEARTFARIFEAPGAQSLDSAEFEPVGIPIDLESDVFGASGFTFYF